jgi:hypothetical protein
MKQQQCTGYIHVWKIQQLLITDEGALLMYMSINASEVTVQSVIVMPYILCHKNAEINLPDMLLL